MRLLAEFKRNNFFFVIIVLVLTGYQLIRVIAFASVYGGLEHDSGWFLGVSRSLAERGAYTSLVSTIADPTVLDSIDVDQKYNIQAPDGRIWFFTGNGTGPASIVPNALISKLFGFDFWALRAGPLIFYTVFLIVAAYTLYQLAGIGAVLLFHIFLFCYPHLSIFLAYEAMGEVPAMFYLISAYLLFAIAIRRQDYRQRYFFICGLIAGLAVNTKLLALLSVSGILAWGVFLWWFKPKSLRLHEGIVLGSGIILVQGVWEFIQLIVLVRLTNFESYLRHVQQRWQFVLDDGSGLDSQSRFGLEFIGRKFFLLREVAHPERWVTALIFASILLGGLLLLWVWRSQEYRQNLLATIWLGWLGNTVWFVGIAKTGWPRHFWFGLVLAVVLLCTIPIALIQVGQARIGQQEYRKTNLVLMAASWLVLALVGWGFISQPYVWSFFLPDEIVPYWQEKRVNNNYQPTLPWIIIPRAAQAEVVEYIKHMPPEANIYYPYAHKGAEIATLTGRINYPLERRSYPGVAPHPADILLIHPYIVSTWVHDPTMRQDLLSQVEQVCPHPVLQNDFYMICLVEELRLPQ